MPASMIENDGEVNRWFEEERPYSHMIDQYRSKYGKETTVQFWSKQRERRGFKRRNVRDDNLIPWRVKVDHAYKEEPINLRREARRRAGLPIGKDPDYQAKALAELDSWIARLAEDDAVVHYDADTEQGWFLVPRRQGVDLDLIHEPEERLRTKVKGLAQGD